MNVDINIGNNKVIASGTFVTDKEENNISFIYNNQKLNFNFLIKHGEPSIKSYPKQDNDGVVVELVHNKFTPMGSTNIEPLQLVLLDNNEYIYLRFEVRAIDKVKIVNYTFYSGDSNG